MNVGGPAVLLDGLIESFDPTEIAHLLVTGKCGPDEADYLQAHPITSPIKVIGSLGRRINILEDVVAFAQLVSTLRSFKPDVIHTHTSKAGVIGRIASLIACRKAIRIHTFHGHLLYGYFSKLKLRLVVLTEKVLARKTDYLIAVSNQVKMDLLNSGIGAVDKWGVIHPGVDVSDDGVSLSSEKLINWEPNGLNISWVGRFTSIKNPMLALESFSLMLRSYRGPIKLVMAGDGLLLEECKSYVSENHLPVEFLGWVSDIHNLLSASDLLILSSRNEGMPVVIIEAAARNTPTLSTNVGGVNEFIVDGETGFLAGDSATEFSQALLAVVRNPEELRKVGARAFDRAIEDFSSAQYNSKHRALYLESADKKRVS